MQNFYKSSCARAVLLAVLWPGLTLAQSPAPQVQAAPAMFAISGFVLTGENPLGSADSDRVLAPFIGPNRTIETLQQATAALEAEFKAQGFALYRAILPPQEVGATVSLKVVKFVIGKITVQGNEQFSEANIRASLPELRADTAPNFKTLAVQTAIANENPGKQVQVSLKESDEADKIDAKLVVKESKPWNFSASLSNMGSAATGQDRLALVGGYANLFDLDQQFSGAYTTSLQRRSDVKQLGLSYRIPLYRQGGVIGVSYTNSDVEGSFGSFNSSGAGQTFGVNYNYYLPPDGGRRSYLTLGLDNKRFNAAQINGVVDPLKSDRTSRPLSLAYAARVESDTVVWSYNTELAVNIPGGSSNSLAAYQSEDVRITNVSWKVLRAGANYLSAFASGWLWAVRAQFQYSPDALISGEQFGLGGVTSLRGTGERVLASDSGLSGTLETTSTELRPGWRALGFIDTGWLRNHNSEANSNKPAADHLLSAGLGLRYASPSYALAADWGRIVTGSVLALQSGSTIPQSGDQKFHINLTARF